MSVKVRACPGSSRRFAEPQLGSSRVACFAVAGLVRASSHGAPGSLVPRASSLLVAARPFLRRAAASPAHANSLLRPQELEQLFDTQPYSRNVGLEYDGIGQSPASPSSHYLGDLEIIKIFPSLDVLEQLVDKHHNVS